MDMIHTQNLKIINSKEKARYFSIFSILLHPLVVIFYLIQGT